MSIIRIFIFAWLISTTHVHGRGKKRQSTKKLNAAPPISLSNRYDALSTEPKSNGRVPAAGGAPSANGAADRRNFNHPFNNNLKETTSTTTTTTTSAPTTAAIHWSSTDEPFYTTTPTPEYNPASSDASLSIVIAEPLSPVATNQTLLPLPPDAEVTLQSDLTITTATISLSSATSARPLMLETATRVETVTVPPLVPMFDSTFPEDSMHKQSATTETGRAAKETTNTDVTETTDSSKTSPARILGFNNALESELTKKYGEDTTSNAFDVPETTFAEDILTTAGNFEESTSSLADAQFFQATTTSLDLLPVESVTATPATPSTSASPTTDFQATSSVSTDITTLALPVTDTPTRKPPSLGSSLKNKKKGTNVMLSTDLGSGTLTASKLDDKTQNAKKDNGAVPETEQIPEPEPQGPNPCKYYQHLTTPTYTCCRGRTYPVSEKFQMALGKCYLQNKKRGEETSIHDTLWDLYSCIWSINANRGFTAKAMYNVYAMNFSTEIAKEIDEHLEKLKDENIIPTGVELIEDRKKLRAMYHHVERGVCEENYSPPLNPNDKNYLKCTDISTANSHERGDCCLGKPVPIRLDFFHQIDASGKTCMHFENANLTFSYQDSSMQQICSTYCGLLASNWFTSDDVHLNSMSTSNYVFPLQHALDLLLSAFSPDRKIELKQAMDLEMDPTNFTLSVYDYLEYNNLLQLGNIELEFEDNPDDLQKSEKAEELNKAETYMIMCESWNVLVRKLEGALYSYWKAEITEDKQTT